ncbi:MAG: trypsin-like peptidase domain-containing protein, partial [Bosea sp. (in: a-proteobacteria)]
MASHHLRDLRIGLIAGGSALALLALVTGLPSFAQNTAQNSARPDTSRAITLASPSTGAVASFADVVDKVKPAVVSVRVKARAANVAAPFGGDDMNDLPQGHPLERFFKRRENGRESGREGRAEGRRGQERMAQSQGSGFFISADGYIVTNHHVIENGVEVQVVMDDGRTLNAKIIGADPRTDVALLKVEEKGEYPFVRFAGGNPRIGDWVVAVGNPFGLGGTVTAGIVSARGRDIGAGPYDDFLQIDAPVNRGNSGGPSFNLNGEVVGVNTAIASPSGGSVGIAFASPSSKVTQIVAQLKESGSVARGFLGVQIQPVTPEVANAIGLKEPKG